MANQTPITALAALQAAMVKCYAKISDVLTTVTTAITEVSNAKADKKHTHTKSDVGLGSVDNTADKDKTVKAANSLNATLLEASTNLNNITTPGFYYCPANATVQTFTNCPTKNALFLEVGRHAGYYQRVTEYMTSGAKTWYRNYYSNAWGSWYRIYSESDKPPDTNTNTWRGVQNNLTSTSTTDGLTAAMGKKLNDEKAAKVATAALTIPNTGWGTDSTVTGYTAYVDVAVSGLTANDVVVVMIAAKSASVADTACLCGACESLAGKLRIRAKHTPTAALSAVYYIVR